jgi:hypothetical protein
VPQARKRDWNFEIKKVREKLNEFGFGYDVLSTRHRTHKRRDKAVFFYALKAGKISPSDNHAFLITELEKKEKCDEIYKFVYLWKMWKHATCEKKRPAPGFIFIFTITFIYTLYACYLVS